MALWLGIFVAGGLGSGLRVLTSTAVNRLTGSPFPWGTLTANALGCLVMGALGFWILEARMVPRDWGLPLTSGFLGGFTTFSAFSFETLKLLERREPWAALGYAGGSLVIGVLFAWIGNQLARGWSAV